MIKRIFFNLLFIVALFTGMSGIQPPEMPVQAAPDAIGAMPPPTLQFAGIDRTWGGYMPGENDIPNTTGAAGHTHFLQAVNEEVALYQKDGLRVFWSPFENFWAGAFPNDPLNLCNGGPQNHHSFPYVMYDHMARRWVVADIAYADVDNGPYNICVAVSKPVPVPVSGGPNDPTYFTPTYWFYYSIPTSASQPHYKPENLKLGLWPDGYYMSADLVDVTNSGLNRTPKGVKVWALNRDDMVNGQVSTFRYIPFYLNEDIGFEHLVPTNLIGVQPPTGTPNYFASIQPGKLHFWKFTANWIQPATSTFGKNLQPDVTYNTDTASNWAMGYRVPQLGTTEKLNLLGDRLMSPMQYRILDGDPALWVNHTVMRKLNGLDVSAIRWYEFRDLNSNPFLPSIYQQGTYYPDNNYRWLGSLAVDKRGNMAVGFSISGTGMYPSINYAGRLVEDPLGELSQGENTLYFGTTFQDNGNPYEDGLWGLQSQMSIDPLDECIFWYTNMYYDAALNPFPVAGQNLFWSTRIGYFSFQQCRGGGTERVSLHTDGTQGNHSSGMDYEMYSSAISDDGRYVAFSSSASNLVDDDTNGKRDIFLRDRDVDEDGIFDEPGQVKTIRISQGPNGLQSNGDSWEVSMTYDGRYIAYSSDANNLLSTVDTNGTRDIFVYDRDTDWDGIFDEPGETSTILASAVHMTPAGQGRGMSDQPFISGNGQYVAFRSFANNLGGAGVVDTNSTSDIYVRDLWYNDTYLVSGWAGIGGWTAGNGPSYTPTLSANGRYVAYATEAFDLFPDANGPLFSDVLVYDLWGGGTTLVSLSTLGAQGNLSSYTPYISGNGNYVVFASRAINLMPAPLVDTNGYADIFVRDLILNTTNPVSVSFFGTLAVGGDSYSPSITYDGLYIAFASDAYNLDVGLKDINAARDVFLHDRSQVMDGVYTYGLTQRISLSFSRTESNDHSFAPVIAPLGRHVAYTSEATNLVVNDTNSYWDVFAFDSEKQFPVFLRVDTTQKGGPGDFVDVPIYFDGNNMQIHTTTFSVDFDQVCLDFLNQPGDIVFNPALGAAGLFYAATYDGTDLDGEFDVYVYDGIPPYTPIPNGMLLTITFRVRSTCVAYPGSENSARVGFSRNPPPSFASSGYSVPGMTKDGFVRIGAGKPGDCNGDGLVDAGDLSGIINELFDPDGSDPTQTPNFWPGNEVGCNPNQDFVVDAGDLSCTILIIQGNGSAACAASFSPDEAAGTIAMGAPASSKVSLSLPSRVPALPGEKVTLPIKFDAQDASVSALVFSINYDEKSLIFNEKDIVFDLPGSVMVRVSVDTTGGEIDVAILRLDGALPSGEIGTVTFTTISPASNLLAEVAGSTDPAASFGSTAGFSLDGLMIDGSVFIDSFPHRVYLPLTRR